MYSQSSYNSSGQYVEAEMTISNMIKLLENPELVDLNELEIKAIKKAVKLHVLNNAYYTIYEQQKISEDEEKTIDIIKNSL